MFAVFIGIPIHMRFIVRFPKASCLFQLVCSFHGFHTRILFLKSIKNNHFPMLIPVNFIDKVAYLHATCALGKDNKAFKSRN